MKKVTPITSINDIERPPLKKTENIDTPATSIRAASDVSKHDELVLRERVKSDQPSAVPVDEYFKDYFNEREEKKNSIYGRVISFGFYIFTIALFIFFCIYWLLKDGVLWAIGMIVPTLIRVIGLCIMSTVPSDRFDFLYACVTNPIYMKAISFGGIVLLGLFATLIIYLYPTIYGNYAATLMFYIFVVWHVFTFTTVYSSEESAYFWFFMKVKYSFMSLVYAAVVFYLAEPFNSYSAVMQGKNIVALVVYLPLLLYYSGQFLTGEWKAVAVKGSFPIWIHDLLCCRN